MRRATVAIAAASAVHRSIAFQAAAAPWRNIRRPGFVASPDGRGFADDPIDRRRDVRTSLTPRFAAAAASSSSSSSFAESDDDDETVRLPTMEQLSSDSFMKQISYASEAIVPLLSDVDRDDETTDLLSAQLSHSDGIRGFFVSYLTGGGGDDDGVTTAADDDVVPAPLREAMAAVDAEELVPLACMNVIMPTAMVTMHEDPELSASSARTAERGAKVLGALLETNESHAAVVRNNCAAILAVANGEAGRDADDDDDDQELLRYWSEFCDKWGYGPKQLEDIAGAVSEFC